MTNYNDLIHGKNPQGGVVGIEPTDSGTELFIQEPDGFVRSEIIETKLWMVSENCLDNHFHPMKGNLPYKFIKVYDNPAFYFNDRRKFKNESTFSIWDKKESMLTYEGITYFKGLKPEDLSVLSFDIETVGLNKDSTSKILIISNTFRNNKKIIRKMFTYDQYETQGDMLKSWCEWVMQIDPSIIVGHNIYDYDLPYMIHIAKMEGIELNLGRNGSAIEIDDFTISKRKAQNDFQEFKRIRIYGREVIDTLFLAWGYDGVAKKYESYGLKNIVKQEGLEIENRQFYDASQIRFKYKDPIEWEKIKKYAEFDADDSLNIYDLMCPYLFYMTQSVSRSYQHMLESATGGQINNMMVRAYLKDNHSLPKISPTVPYEGAISLGNPGIYSNVFKIDIASLYPNIILEYQVYDEIKDPKGVLLKLVETFTKERLHNKKLAKNDKYYDDLQGAQKIFINSMYGFMGSSHNIFNYPTGASYITETGRNILEHTMGWAKSKQFKLVNADTDSIAFCYQDESVIKENEQNQLVNEINDSLPDRIKYEPDGYYKTVVVVKAKNYILYDGKKIKYKGSAIKATVKEPALKEFIKEIIDSMLERKENYVEIYTKYVKEIMSIQDIKRWANRKTITSKVLNPERTNEQNVKDAIRSTEYTEGDRAYFYYDENDQLTLVENFKGGYNKKRLLEKLYKTTLSFETIIPKGTFVNYSLKKNQDLLKEIK
jgi:DNA polymerase elongation subunit (family B)